MSKSLKSSSYEPVVKISHEEFEQLMQELDSVKRYNSNYDVEDEVNIFFNDEDVFPILHKYGLVDDDDYAERMDNVRKSGEEGYINGETNERMYSVNPCHMESDILKGVEKLTGYNTFPYSKQSYMTETDAAVRESILSKCDVVTALKRNLKDREERWHNESEVPIDKVTGKNIHKDDEHLYGMKKNQSQKSAIDFIGEISKYSNNQYVKLLYDLAVQYNEKMYNDVQSKFGESKLSQSVDFDEFLSKQQEKPYVTPTQGDAAFSRFDSKRDADIQMGDDIGVKVGPTGTMYGYDTSKGESNTQSNTQRRSYGGEVDKYLNSTIENTPKQLQLGD